MSFEGYARGLFFKGTLSSLWHYLYNCMNNAARENLANITLVALTIVGAASLLTVAIIFPNLLKTIDLIQKTSRSYKKGQRQVSEKQVRHALYYLKCHGYIRMQHTGIRGSIALLTNRGKYKLAQYEFEILSIPKQKWSHTWWLVVGDIPTRTHRRSADLFRDKLKKLGLYPLQRTVWLYPHDPRQVLGIVLERYALARFVTVMHISQLDKDDGRVLLRHFRKANVI
jgi:hypothetical protein